MLRHPPILGAVGYDGGTKPSVAIVFPPPRKYRYLPVCEEIGFYVCIVPRCDGTGSYTVSFTWNDPPESLKELADGSLIYQVFINDVLYRSIANPAQAHCEHTVSSDELDSGGGYGPIYLSILVQGVEEIRCSPADILNSVCSSSSSSSGSASSDSGSSASASNLSSSSGSSLSSSSGSSLSSSSGSSGSSASGSSGSSSSNPPPNPSGSGHSGGSSSGSSGSSGSRGCCDVQFSCSKYNPCNNHNSTIVTSFNVVCHDCDTFNMNVRWTMQCGSAAPQTGFGFGFGTVNQVPCNPGSTITCTLTIELLPGLNANPPCLDICPGGTFTCTTNV